MNEMPMTCLPSYRPTISWIARVLWVLAGMFSAADAVHAVDIGINLTHLSSHCTNQKASKAVRPVGVWPADNIILNYDNDAVRTKALAMMRRLRLAGVSVLRSFIWFAHKEDPRATSAGDNLGIAIASNGRLPDGIVKNITKFTQDVASLGFARLDIVAAPRGAAGPKCKRKKFGDCFDERLLPLSWSVTEQIAQTVRTSAGARLDAVIDIGHEMCSGPVELSPARKQNERYVAFMMREWNARFHDSAFVISCIGDPIDRLRTSLADLVNIYRSSGMRPAAIDIHIYESDRGTIAKSLKIAEAAATTVGVPLDIMETPYDNFALADAISMDDKSASRPRTVGLWPRRISDKCQIEEPEPPSVAQFADELAR